MDKITQVNIEGHNYGFVAGQTVRGVSGAQAADYVKVVTLPEGASLTDGMLLAVTFVNGNTAGFAGTKKAYSSDGQNFYWDSQLTDPVTLPPVGCYTMTLVSGEEYDFQAYPAWSINGSMQPFCDSRGHPCGGPLWAAGDTVTVINLDGKFIALQTTYDEVKAGVSLPVTSDAVAQAVIDVFNTVYPIGCTYTQYPMQKAPTQLWGSISTWKVINYGGAFFRAEGGNAMSFDSNRKSITAASGNTITIVNHGASVGTVILDYAEDSAGHIIRNESRVVTAVNGNVLTLNSQFTSTASRSVLISQNQATAPNGLSLGSYSHRHTANMYYGGATNNNNADYWNNGTSYNHETSYKRQVRTSEDTHSHTISSSDTETRPTNFVYKIWVRTA